MNVPPKIILNRLYQPSLLLLGLGTILAFTALRWVAATGNEADQRDARLIIYVSWGTLFIITLLWRALGWYLAPKRDFEQNKEFIGLFTQIATAVLLIVSLWFTWQGMRGTQKATEKNLVLAEQTLKNSLVEKKEERYMRALEKLGEDTPWERIAGMTALQRVAADIAEPTFPPGASEEEQRVTRERAEKEHFELMRVLTDYVQEKASCKPSCAKTPSVPAEVREALRIIGERKLTYAFEDKDKMGERKAINLIGTDLRGQGFSEQSNFEGVLFRKAHLEGATLSGVRLKGANFEEAHLQKANLNEADLTDAILIDAHLEGADLSGARGVNAFQLRQAYMDSNTRCPEGFTQKAEKCEKTEP